MSIVLSFLLVIILIIAISVYIFLCTRFSNLRSDLESMTEQMEEQFNKRNELLPPFLEITKSVRKSQNRIGRKMLEACKKLNALPSCKMCEKMAISIGLSEELKQVIVLSDTYPKLKENTQFIEISEELTTIENKLVVLSHQYNEVIVSYNMKVETFPSNVVACIQKFKKLNYVKMS